MADETAAAKRVVPLTGWEAFRSGILRIDNPYNYSAERRLWKRWDTAWNRAALAAGPGGAHGGGGA